MSTPVRGRDEFGFHCIIMRQGNPEMLGVLAATKDLFGASRVLPRVLPFVSVSLDKLLGDKGTKPETFKPQSSCFYFVNSFCLIRYKLAQN